MRTLQHEAWKSTNSDHLVVGLENLLHAGMMALSSKIQRQLGIDRRTKMP
jgi:hypothetical protein